MKRYLILTLALGFTACMNSQDAAVEPAPSSQDAVAHGQIQLVAMKGLSKVAASQQTSGSSTTYVFDLDTANSSIQQYFLLQNTGDCDVQHVKLVSNNSHFYFSPSEIDLVPPAKSSALLQLVKLSVIHGTKINGVGPDSLLPKGNNVATIQLTGSTTNANHDSINISQDVQLKVYAKVFDVDFFGFDTVPVNMAKNNMNYGGISGLSGDGIRGYYVGIKPYNSSTLKILNSGNASFKVTVFHAVSGVAVASDSMEVAAGATMNVSLVEWPGAPAVEIDAHGVVAKSEKLWLQPSVNASSNGKFLGLFFPSGW